MQNNTNLKVATFKSRFKGLCEENPMNDTAIADALHVSKQTVSAWKTGERSPRDLTVQAIANYFGVTIEWLMGFNVTKYKKDMIEENDHKSISMGNDRPMTEEARIISEGIDKMEPERREQALKVMQAIFSDIFDGGIK